MFTRTALSAAFLCSVMTSMSAAAPLPMQINFGADVSGTAGYENYVHAEDEYDASVGYGWTFNSNIELRDRTATHSSVPPSPDRTFALDKRPYPDGGVDNPFTFRVDLPNGLYYINGGIGDTGSDLNTVVMVGDTFLSSGNTSALDESASSTQFVTPAEGILVPRVTDLENDYQVLPESGTLIFEVTEEFMLVGFRRVDGKGIVGDSTS